MRHAVRAVGAVQARDVHQVGDHSASGRFTARALAVVQRGADGIAMDHDRVHGAFNVGDQALGRHQAGVHAQLHALRYALGDTQQLDAVAQLLGIANIGSAELGNALNVSLVKLHRDAERDGAHQRGLVRGVHAFDVEGRVGFGVTQALGLFQHHGKVQALVAHFAEDEVGRAVDDAGDPLDAVGGQAFAQRFDDGNATSYRGLECHHHALGMGRRKNLGPVHGQQRLVRRHHMLAGGDGFEHQGFGDAVAADQLDHDVDLGVGDHGASVVDHLHAVTNDGLGARRVQVGDHGDGNAATGATLDFLLVALKYLEYAAADGAYAQKAYLDRFHSEAVRN